MRAFEVLRRGHGEVRQVAEPVPGPGEALVTVAFAGVCGTDVGLFDADDERMREIRSHHPLRLGHEFSGTVTAVGPPGEPTGDGARDTGRYTDWVGRRVTAEPMLGCRRCQDCLAGAPNLCADRLEVGVRGGWPGALAERLVVPVHVLHELPGPVDLLAGALVEPGANAWRTTAAAGAGPGVRVLVLGSGAIGLLCVQFAAAAGSEVHVLGIDAVTLALARDLGATACWGRDDLPALRWDAVIDATDAPSMPAYALDVVRPGGVVVLIGVAHQPSTADLRQVVRGELTVRGVLGATQGFGPTVDAFALGAVRPHPLVGAVIGLEDVAAALGGWRPAGCGSGPKLVVDPSR